MEAHPHLDKYYGKKEDRRKFLDQVFDRGAQHYDWVAKVLALGTGQFYRRRVLRKGGVEPGLRVLDIATGTGLTAQAVLDVLGGKGLLVGLDPSSGMLHEARKKLAVPLLRGLGDHLPFRDRQFDLITMGFAMRHLDDLEGAFREYRRVLRDGGRVLLLEISRPKTKLGMAATRLYFQRLLPGVTRLGTKSDQAKLMMDYYWDTIEQCVPPEHILAALRAAGFASTERKVSLGIFSEYWATR